MLQRSYERSSEEWARLFATSGWDIINQTTHHNHTVYTLQKATSKATPGLSGSTAATVTSSFNPTALYPSCVTTDGNGNGRVSKAVIPIAGLGTRMYPVSTIIPKALLPVFVNDKAGKGDKDDKEDKNNKDDKTNEDDKDRCAVKIDFALHHLLTQILSVETGITQVT